MIILEFIYPFFISFILVFISELGDKTQLIALSFSSKLKFYVIILGVALGSFFSHGIAILFGSFLGNIENPIFQNILKIITYTSFIIFGIITIKQKNSLENPSSKSNNITKRTAFYICPCAVVNGNIFKNAFKDNPLNNFQTLAWHINVSHLAVFLIYLISAVKILRII